MTKNIAINEFMNLIQFFNESDLKTIGDCITDDMIASALKNKSDYGVAFIKENYSGNLKPKPIKSASIYLIRNNRNGFTKIGWSKNPKQRERTLQSQEPELELILVSECLPQLVEANLHRRFKDKRIRGEWFNLDENDINFLKNLQSECI